MAEFAYMTRNRSRKKEAPYKALSNDVRTESIGGSRRPGLPQGSAAPLHQRGNGPLPDGPRCDGDGRDQLGISPFTASANLRMRRTSSLTSWLSHVANIVPTIRSRALSTASVMALPL